MDLLKGFHEEFGWFIWGLVGLGFLWYFTGGPERESSKQGQFIKPLAPVDTGQIYGNYFGGTPNKDKQTLNTPEDPAVLLEQAESKVNSFLEESQQAQQIHATSLLAKTISFDGIAGAKNTPVDEEYIRIVANKNAQQSTQISGLTLSGLVKKIRILVPRAAELPIVGTTAVKSNIILPPSGRALIASGRSPIGTSFRVNMCTGYLDQFQSYTPGLLKNCPEPKDELEKFGPSYESSCREFVDKIPRCRVHTGSFPSDISSACREFVVKHLNYNTCVVNHKNDAGFLANEWRIFLDQNNELWNNNNEIIRLIDTNGKTIDAITY